MRRSFRRGAAAALVAMVAGGAAAQAPRPKADLAEFDARVAKAVKDWRVPGLAIAIVKDDSVVFVKGYGVRELGKPEPVTVHTRFAAGSTTKAMTTAALAMLVDERKLRWDDRVIDLLPDFRLYDPYATRELTVRDLLTHRSGLAGTDLLWLRGDLPLDDMIRRLRYVQPTASFRSTWQYQNNVYAIAGAIVAKLSGMPWEQFLRARLFTPLGMNETLPLVANLAGASDVATPHRLVRDTVKIVPVRSTDQIAPAGSVWTSVADIARWMNFMLDSGRVGNRRLISSATFDEIIAPQVRAPMAEYPALRLARPNAFSYALGWFVQDYHGATVWMHTGSIDGMSAIVGLMPGQRLGVYVLENLDHAELRHALMYQAFDLFTGAAPRDWSADLKALFDAARSAAPAAPAALAAGQGAAPRAVAPATPSLSLERYAGTYADSTYGDVVVSVTDGALSARFGPLDLGRLEAGPYDTFRSGGPGTTFAGTTVSFVPDGRGGVSALRLLGATFTKSRRN